MEKDKNDFLRTRVFYCDPMQSGQKGSLENNHSELRYILVKHVDLKAIGLVDQSALNLVLSHVNSLPIEKFGGKSPFDILEFLFPDLYEKLLGFGLQKIPSNEIVLKPYLLKDTRPKKAKKILSNPEKESVAKEVIAPVPPKKPPHSCTKNLKPSALTEAEMLQLKYEGLSPQQIAQRMELSVATYYRRLAALKKR